jgi:hypothetical protein
MVVVAVLVQLVQDKVLAVQVVAVRVAFLTAQQELQTQVVAVAVAVIHLVAQQEVLELS